MSNISVILLAISAGRRCHSYGSRALFKFPNNQTVLDNQVEVLHSAFKNPEIILVSGFDTDKIARVVPKGVKLVENESYLTCGPIRSTLLGLRVASRNNILIIHGDMLFNEAAISSFKNESAVLVAPPGTLHRSKVGLNIQDGLVRSFSYGVEKKWGQCLFLKGVELDYFRKRCMERRFSTWTIPEISDKITSRPGLKLRAIEVPTAKLREINHINDVEEFL